MFFVYVLKTTKLKSKSQERNPGVGTPRPLPQHRASGMVSHPRMLRGSRVVLRNFYVVRLKNDRFLHPPIYLLSLLISECLQVTLASAFVEKDALEAKHFTPHQRERRKRTHQAYKLVDSQVESKPHLATLKTAVL